MEETSLMLLKSMTLVNDTVITLTEYFLSLAPLFGVSLGLSFVNTISLAYLITKAKKKG